MRGRGVARAEIRVIRAAMRNVKSIGAMLEVLVATES
jgi:hypothetical protein